jgi:hypothetical protein
MATHEQVWVKVNAQVDRDVAELVEALSEIPELMTLESCQTNGDSVWVCFVSGDSGWEQLARMALDRIGPPLVAEFGDRISISLGIAESGQYRAEMTVFKGVISAVSEAIRKLAKPAKAA